VLLSVLPIYQTEVEEMAKEKLPKIYFLDVTNRDGVQTAKLGLS